MRNIGNLLVFALGVSQISAGTVKISTEHYNVGDGDIVDCPSGGLSFAEGACSINAGSSTNADNTYDYESSVIGLRSQMLDDEATDLSEVVGSDNNRWIKLTIELDDAVNEYDSCSVAIDGDSELKDVVALGDASSDVTNKNKPSCSFRLSNKRFLGEIKVGATFVKNSYSVAPGEDSEVKALVDFAFESHANDPGFGALQNENVRDLVVSYNKGCVSAGGYLVADKAGDDACNLGQEELAEEFQHKELEESKAARGKVSLKLTGVFVDKRYRVLSQSGVDRLPSSQGDLLIVKEGLDLAQDYESFHDGAKDVNSIGGDGSIMLTPIDYANRKDENSTVSHAEEEVAESDFSNVGGGAGALQGYGSVNTTAYPPATLDNDLYKCDGETNCYSQYVLSTVVDFEYGELPHFKPGYLGCTVCPSALSIKGLKEVSDDTFHINTKLSLSALDLPIAPSDFSFKAVKLVAKDALKLSPNDFYKLSTLFSVEESSEDIQNAAGVALVSLDDELKFDEFLSFSALSQDGLEEANTMALVNGTGANDGCAALIGLKLKDLETDIVRGYLRHLNENCFIELPKNFFGTKQTISYNNTQTGDAAAEADIIEVDQHREIHLINPKDSSSVKLSLVGRTRAYASQIFSTIQMELMKHFPDEAIPAGLEYSGNLKDSPVVFRIAGSSDAMAGHVSTSDGGKECAGDGKYWKSTDRAERIYAATGAEYVPESTAQAGLPYGTCDGAVGLPDVLTQADAVTNECGGDGSEIPDSVFGSPRCLGGTYGTGQLVQYKDCKLAGGIWKIVSIPDATEADVGAASIGECAEPAVQEEVLFMTSSVNNDPRPHRIRSTDKCTGTLDLQLEDQTLYQGFAIYKTRIDCARISTTAASDRVDLKYRYESSLDLALDKFEVTAHHTNLTTRPEYSVKAKIGTCGAANEFALSLKKGTCDPAFVADGDSKLVAETPDTEGLELLLNCSRQTGGIQTLVDSYVITYDIAMQYTRNTTLHTSGAFSGDIKYCEDQAFVATINRKATGTVTAATIENADLLRAVLVHDIGWTIAECPANQFRLEVVLSAKDKDTRGVSSWGDSYLTSAFMDTQLGAKNKNLMAIHSSADSQTIQNGLVEVASADNFEAGNQFKVRGPCIAITECDLSDANDAQNGDSWKDFSTEFQTDMVIRGTFLTQEVDTLVELTLNFEECPVEGETTVTGTVRVGLATTCNAKQSELPSIAQPLVESHDAATAKKDCTSAFADDILRVDGFAFVIASECTEAEADKNSPLYNEACALLKPEHELALVQQWSPSSVDVFVDRYDESGALTSETQLCACRSPHNCSIVTDIIPGLPGFNRASAPSGEYLACGVQGNDRLADFGTDLFKHQIPLLPFSSADADRFVVRYDVILSSGLTTRRLRATAPFKHTPKLQSSSAETEGSAHGIRVLAAGSVSENTASEDAPSAGVADNGAQQTEEAADGSHTHDADDHTHNDESMVALIVILSVLGAGIVGFAIYYLTCRKSEEEDESEESKSLVGGDKYRTQRFKNLRY